MNKQVTVTLTYSDLDDLTTAFEEVVEAIEEGHVSATISRVASYHGTMQATQEPATGEEEE